MAPLSVLPGRVRFEIPGLVGRKGGCLKCEDNLRSVPGITEVSASHRTGRLLVCFDEQSLQLCELDVCLRTALQAAEDASESTVHVSSPSVADDDSFSAGRLVREMFVHTLLPAPLDLILPAAMGMLRRQTVGA